jgi:hypothetical protein
MLILEPPEILCLAGAQQRNDDTDARHGQSDHAANTTVPRDVERSCSLHAPPHSSLPNPTSQQTSIDRHLVVELHPSAFAHRQNVNAT